MIEAAATTTPSRTRTGAAILATVVVVIVALAAIDDPERARATALAGGCLALWLSEAVPAFVPTLALLALAPVALGRFDPGLRLGPLMATAADPVLGLFFGGFALAVAATRHGIDAAFTHRLLAWSRGRRRRLVGLLLVGTAFLSMWMSYIGVAAMMFGAIAPLLSTLPRHDRLRQGLLLAIAVGANIGAMSTPVASGPNAIAVGSAEATHPISFLAWMAFALPLMAILLAIAYAIVIAWLRLQGEVRIDLGQRQPLTRSGRAVVVVAIVTIAAWLSEPWHGVSAPIVALAMAAALFAARLLRAADLAAIDWPTLLLIAGGLMVGRLCEQTGVVAILGDRLAGIDPHHWLMPWLFVFLSAAFASVMSNTGTAALLIPLAIPFDAHPPTLAIMIALGASLGMPFTISSPPNALAAGRGLGSWPLLALGGGIMLLGCALIAASGRFALAHFGLG
jgi:sodium-dependent dicarboxylate transporter 2/3/5